MTAPGTDLAAQAGICWEADETDEYCARRRGLERLLRKVLRMPSRPAVVYYHYWPPRWPMYHGSFWLGGEHFSEVGHSRQCTSSECSAYAECRVRARSGFWTKSLLALWQEILGYYGVPALSLRQAIHHRMAEEPELVRQMWWPEEVSRDQLHPTCVGQRCTSMQLCCLAGCACV